MLKKIFKEKQQGGKVGERSWAGGLGGSREARTTVVVPAHKSNSPRQRWLLSGQCRKSQWRCCPTSFGIQCHVGRHRVSQLAHRGTPSGTADRHMGCQGHTGLKALARRPKDRQARRGEGEQGRTAYLYSPTRSHLCQDRQTLYPDTISSISTPTKPPLSSQSPSPGSLLEWSGQTFWTPIY